MCSEREGKEEDRPVPALPQELQRVLDRILDDDRAIFEALARL
jgi:hypothetical protein